MATFQQHHDSLTRLETALDQKVSELSTAINQKEIRAEIKDLTSSIQGLLERARVVAEEQESEGEKGVMLDKLARHEKELDRLKGGVRKATLQAQEAAQKRSAQERSELLEGVTGQSVRKRGAGGGDGASKALAASAAVSSSLSRLQQTMAAELARSSNTAQVLESSSNTLASTHQETSTIDSRLGKAKSLLKRIGQNNWFDMAVTLLGVFVFACVILFILKRRVYDKVF